MHENTMREPTKSTKYTQKMSQIHTEKTCLKYIYVRGARPTSCQLNPGQLLNEITGPNGFDALFHL